MLENSVVSAGLKLNELAGLEVGAGVVLLTLKDAGKNAKGITYADLYQAMQLHLAQRLCLSVFRRSVTSGLLLSAVHVRRCGGWRGRL